MTHYLLLTTFGVLLTTGDLRLTYYLQLTRLECAAAPGSGGCAAMFTASSMAFAIEVNQVTTYSYYLLFGTWPCNRGDGYGSLLTNLLTYYSTKTNLP